MTHSLHIMFLLVCHVLQALRDVLLFREILRLIPISLIMRSTLQRTFSLHCSNGFIVFSSVELLVSGVYYVKPNYDDPLSLFRVLRVQL
jgi:hypothetical protein